MKAGTERAFLFIMLTAFIAIVGYYLSKAWQSVAAAIPDAARKVRDYIADTPNRDDSNIISNAVNVPVQAATGGDTIGTLLASWFDPATKAAEAMANAQFPRKLIAPVVPISEANIRYDLEFDPVLNEFTRVPRADDFAPSPLTSRLGELTPEQRASIIGK